MRLAEHAGQEAFEAQEDPADAAKLREAMLAFNRLPRCVHATFALESRIAATSKLPAAPTAVSKSANDPRRPAIKEFMLDLIDASPEPKSVKSGLRRQLDPVMTKNLEKDLEQDHPAGYIVLEVCRELGLPCCTSDMPDELLKRLHREPTEEEKAEVAGIVHRRIYGRDPP